VIVLVLDDAEAGIDVAEAFAEGELGESKTKKLIATGETARPRIATETAEQALKSCRGWNSINWA
jgi:hypothetical protein